MEVLRNDRGKNTEKDDKRYVVLFPNYLRHPKNTILVLCTLPSNNMTLYAFEIVTHLYNFDFCVLFYQGYILTATRYQGTAEAHQH